MEPTRYEQKFIDAEGIRTCYIEEGEGDPLILVHGGGAGANSYGNWAGSLPLFAKHFRTIAVDMLGFGDTAKPDPASFTYSQPARNAHLAAFVRALGLPKANLIGNSMGGATSLGVAVEHPELVDKLILMGSAGLAGEITPDLQPVINYDFTKEGMVRLIKALTNADFTTDDAMVQYRWKSSVEPATRKAFAATMQWVREQHGLFYPEEYIARVRQPTLVANGKEDKIIPLKQAIRFLELIDNSWGYIIPHCGHWAMIEHPHDFANAVISFIRSH